MADYSRYKTETLLCMKERAWQKYYVETIKRSEERRVGKEC